MVKALVSIHLIIIYEIYDDDDDEEEEDDDDGPRNALSGEMTAVSVSTGISHHSSERQHNS